MGTANFWKSDLNAIHGIVQNTMLSYPKQLLIEILKDEFGKDSYYHYVRDDWGFPHTPNLTDVPITAGLEDNLTTRLFIGEASRFDKKFYPAILVRGGSFRYVPISLSQNEGYIQHKAMRVLDGYGNERIYSVPQYFVLNGAWEGQLTIDILAGDSDARDDLVELVSGMITIVNRKTLEHSGVVFKPISGSSPSESDDGKGKIFKQTITCDIRTEWEQRIPIDTILNTIFFCVDFANLENEVPVIAPNLEAKTLIEIIESL